MPRFRFPAIGPLALVLTIGATGGGWLRAQEAPAPKQKPQTTSPRPLSIASEVEGKTIILKLIPNAARVKKGDVLCELDSAPIRERLNEQQTVTGKASQALAEADADVKVAKARQEAFVEETLAAEEEELTKQVKIAREYEAQCKLELKKLSQSLPDEEYPVRVSKQTLTEATVWRKQTEAALAAFNTKKAGKIRVYAIAIEKAQTTLKARYATCMLEQAKLDKLKTQVAKCTIKAPCAGMVAIAGPSGPHSPPVREGELVREKQLLMRILPDPAAPTAP